MVAAKEFVLLLFSFKKELANTLFAVEEGIAVKLVDALLLGVFVCLIRSFGTQCGVGDGIGMDRLLQFLVGAIDDEHLTK